MAGKRFGRLYVERYSHTARNGAYWPCRRGHRLRLAGNEGAIAAAIAGMGIVMTSSGAVRREMDSGQLDRILGDWDLGPLELNAVHPGGKAVKRSARAFTDYLIDIPRHA